MNINIHAIHVDINNKLILIYQNIYFQVRVSLNVRRAWKQCVLVVDPFPLTTHSANNAGYPIVKRVRTIPVGIIATVALVILMDRTTVIGVVITYVLIIVMGLRYAVFLTIHVICVKTDIT